MVKRYATLDEMYYYAMNPPSARLVCQRMFCKHSYNPHGKMPKNRGHIASLARSYTDTAIKTLAGIMMEQTSPPMARIVAAKTTKTVDQSALHRVPERLVSKRWDQQSDWVPCCGKWGTPPDNFAAPEEMSQSRRNHNVGCN